MDSKIKKWIATQNLKILLAMTWQVCHCEDDRTKQSSQNRLPRLPSGSLAMTTKTT